MEFTHGQPVEKLDIPGVNERVAVVIPYFQREPGLLPRAIRSIFRQKADIDPLVIVVDDGSPLPAEGEIASLDPAQRLKVRLIRQLNGGPGSARNTGLDAVPDDIAYVALMDPDDAWEEDHLEQALTAMRLGYDFFFCDVRGEENPNGYFARTGLYPAEHTALPHPDLYSIADDFFNRCLRHSPIPTSAVVMRRARLGHLRFNERIRPVGEDLLFWLDVARETKQIAFSTRISLFYGEGVSLSSFRDWATAKALDILASYTLYYSEIPRRYDLTPVQARLVRERIHMFQGHFVHTLIAMLRRGRWPNARLLGRYILRNPRILAIAPMAIATGLGRRVA